MKEEKLIENNQYEVIFCVKYNRKIFVDERLKNCAIDAIKQAEEEYGQTKGVKNFEIVEIKVMSNYIKLLINCSPIYGIKAAVNKLKRLSLRNLKEFDPTLASRLPSVWTNHTLYKTIGEKNTEEEIQEYLAAQKIG